MTTAAARPVPRLARPQRVRETTKSTVNLLVYGRPGCGKTTFAATGPGPVLFVDCDEGLLGLENITDKRAQELGIRADEVYSESFTTLPGLIQIIRKQRDNLKQDPNFWGTIVLDNLTDLQRILKENLLQKDEDKPRDLLTQQDWGIILNQMQQIVRAIKHLPCHSVFIAHESEKDTGDWSSLSGKTQEELPGHVDVVTRYVMVEREVTKDGQKVTEVIRRLRCTPQPGTCPVLAKDRSGKLSDWELPNFGALIEKITGKG
jgi:hypothetical protein